MVAVSGGRLAYHRTGGGGPSLVLSHGLTDNGLCWTRLARALEADFDIVMLDARGHGGSTGPVADDRSDPGRDIAEAIDGLGLTSPVVMGHSVGARATAAFAAGYPGLASRVVLEDPPLLPSPDAAEIAARRGRFRRQVEKLHAMTPDEVTAVGRTLSPGWHQDEFPAWTAAKHQVDPDAMPSDVSPWQATIGGITVPTLLIHGEAELGSLISPEIAAQAVALNPAITAVRISGAGHNVRRENFTDYVAAVRAFLIPS